jgi:mono/diheme cytochrome c family protein
MKRRAIAAEKIIGRGRRCPALAACIAGLVCLAPISGCRQDMHDQPKFNPQRGSSFYVDGRSARLQVPGTVARSQDVVDDYFHTGIDHGKEGDGLPIALTIEVLRRGQERYNIYCTPCHSRVGNGMGMIAQRGYYQATSFHSERLRQAPLGHFFQVMTNGQGAMPNYAAELTPLDRWAVAAYIRALQLSQSAEKTDTEPGKKAAELSDIITQQGFSSGFLDVWVPPARPRAMQAMATSVKASTERTTSSGVSREANTGSVLASADSPKAAAFSTGKVEASAPAAPLPAKESVYDLAAGQQVYMRNCAGCHQISRAGMPPNIPSLIGIVSKVGAERIRTVVSTGIPTGKPPMQAFPNLTQDDIENLIAFLQTNK